MKPYLPADRGRRARGRESPAGVASLRVAPPCPCCPAPLRARSLRASAPPSRSRLPALLPPALLPRAQQRPLALRTATISLPDTRTILLLLAGFAIAITVHEFCHALAAYSLGDRTAQREGRLTLNPLRHLDLFRDAVAPALVAFGGPGFGWGKPVPVDGRRLRGGRGLAVVSAAGPFSNVLLAILCSLAIRLVGSRDLSSCPSSGNRARGAPGLSERQPGGV